jgi:uncharacterized protein YeaO (DUF488 family)
MLEVRIKSIFDALHPDDGCRVYVGRAWPSRTAADETAIECWLPELAPSAKLSGWFRNMPGQWPAFCERYRAELERLAPSLDALRAKAGSRRLTLLHAARLPYMNHATVLAAVLGDCGAGAKSGVLVCA